MFRKVFVLLLICLLVSCSDIALRTYIERMTDFENIIYVSIETGDDSNRGVKSGPLKTIQAGIDRAYGYIADGLAETVDVYVAGGLYEVNYREGRNISLREGVSLYGGYTSDFAERDPENNSSVIVDLSGSGGTAGDTNQAVTISEGITDITVIDGFIIKGGGGNLSSALYVMFSSPVIINNIIYGGNSGVISASVSSVDGARPLIKNNRIYGGSSASTNIGIYITRDSLPVIQDNTVTGGTLGNNNNGVLIHEGSNATLTNNNISGGNGVKTFAVVCGTDSRMTLDGNSLCGGTAEAEACGVKNQGFSNEVKNNVINGGVTVDGTVTGINCDSVNGTKIYNNIIYGGNASGTGDSYGVVCNYGSDILNNTVSGGDSGWSAAVCIQNGASPCIENNILFSFAETTGYCIYESPDNGENVQSIFNNNLYDVSGNTVMYRTYAEDEYDTLVLLEVLGYAAGNWDADPAFADADGPDDVFSTMGDNDWHLTASSPVEVRQGGLDGVLEGWVFNTDADGLSRTNLSDGPDDNPANDNAGGWSMGAFEKD